MGDDHEDEGVDSGWDLEEEEQQGGSVTRAVDSTSLLEKMERERQRAARRAAIAAISDELADTGEAPAADPIDLAATVEAPVVDEALVASFSRGGPSSGAPTQRGNVDSSTLRFASTDDEQEPPTRRAEDEELKAMRERVSREPPLRLGTRNPTPIQGLGPKPVDARAHNRSTPPKALPVTTSLRFPQGSLREARARRNTTKVNLQAVRHAQSAEALPSERAPKAGTSRPEIDLHLPDPFGELDLGGDERPVTARPGQPEVTSRGETPRPPPREALGRPARAVNSETRPDTPAARAPSARGDVKAAPQGLRPPQKRPSKLTPPQRAPRRASLTDVQVEVDEAELSDEERAALNAELSEEGLLDVSASVPPPSEDPQLQAVRTRFERGDYVGALRRAEALLEARPDFEQARRYLESSRELLRQMYLDKLGNGELVLHVIMASSDIQNLSLDHRAGFLISLIDGVATIDEVLDMSGMAQLDVLRLLFEMREQGVVAASRS